MDLLSLKSGKMLSCSTCSRTNPQVGGEGWVADQGHFRNQQQNES